LANPTGVRCMEGRCAPHATVVPYDPIAGMIRQLCGISETDYGDGIRERVRSALGSLPGPYPERHVPHILHLLGLPLDVIGLPKTASPEHLKARTFDAVRQLWLMMAEREPIVLVFADLHWVDATSKTLLTSFVNDLAGARILLIVTYRPGFLAPWAAKSYA